MSDLLEALGLLGRLLWGLVRLVFGLMTFLGAIGDLVDLIRRPFRRRDPKATDRRIGRPGPPGLRVASHLGTDLDSPHISHMTPPPGRQDGDKDDRA